MPGVLLCDGAGLLRYLRGLSLRLGKRLLLRCQLTELDLIGFQRLVRLLGRRYQGTCIPRYIYLKVALVTHSKLAPFHAATALDIPGHNPVNSPLTLCWMRRKPAP